jgi:hypothetical protein
MTSSSTVFFNQLVSSSSSSADAAVDQQMRVLEQHGADPDPNRFVALVCAARHSSGMFRLERVGGAACLRWLSRKNHAVPLAQLACAVLLHAYAGDTRVSWPAELIQSFLDDSFGPRLWCGDDTCAPVRAFVANLLTCFGGAAAPLRFHDASQRAQIAQYVVDQARFVLEHEPAHVGACIKTLTQLASLAPVRQLAAQQLRGWLRADAHVAPLARQLAIALVRHDAQSLGVVLQALDAALLAEPALDAALRHAVTQSRDAALLLLDAAVAGQVPNVLLVHVVAALGSGVEAILARRMLQMAASWQTGDNAGAGAGDDDDDDELLLRLARGRRQLYAMLGVVINDVDVAALCDALLDNDAAIDAAAAAAAAATTTTASAGRHFVETVVRCVTWALLLRPNVPKLLVAQVQSRAVAWCHKHGASALPALIRRVLFILPEAATYFPDSSLGSAAQSAALAAVTDGVPLLEPTLVHLIVMHLTHLPLSADDVIGAIETMTARAAAADDDRPLASCELLVDGLLNMCRLPRPSSLPPSVTAPCHAALFWRVVNVLLALGALHGSSVGSFLWRSVPTASIAMRAVLTQRWPDVAGTDDDSAALRSFAAAQLLDEGAVAAADDAAVAERVAHLRASGCIAFERDSSRLVPTSDAQRRHTLHVAANLRIAERLARCRAPDFVLEAAAADEATAAGSAAPWLARLLRSSDALIESVSPTCRCTVLLHIDSDNNNNGNDDDLRRSVAGSLRALLLSDVSATESPLPVVEVLSFFLGRLAAPTVAAREIAFDCLADLLGAGGLEQSLARLPWFQSDVVRRVICDAMLAALAVETWHDRFHVYCGVLARADATPEHAAAAVTKILQSRPLMRGETAAASAAQKLDALNRVIGVKG